MSTPIVLSVCSKDKACAAPGCVWVTYHSEIYIQSMLCWVCGWVLTLAQH